jgi:hypothetical protein
VRSVFDSSASLTRIVTRNGEARVQVLPVWGFIEALGRATGTWKERRFAPEVRIDGPLATVWTEYDFHLGSQFSRCGVAPLPTSFDGPYCHQRLRQHR